MARVRIEVEKQLVEKARRLYEKGSVPVRDIAKMLGMGESTLYVRMGEWQWPARSPRRGRTVAMAAPPLVPSSPPPQQRVDVIERIRRTVEHEVETLEKVLAGAPAGAARSPASERAARTLASLVRTLKELKRLDAEKAALEAHDDDAGAEAAFRDPDSLRRAIADKLERLRAGDEQPPAGGAEPART